MSDDEPRNNETLIERIIRLLTLERVVSILAILGVGGVGVVGVVAKEEGPTAPQMMQEWDKQNNEEHHKIELEQQKSFYERVDTKRRTTDLERYQIESMEMIKEQQKDLLLIQQQGIDLGQEIKDMKEQ